MSLKVFGLTLLLFSAYFLTPVPTLAGKTNKKTRLPASFEMWAGPSHVVVYHNQSISIQIALRNVTDRDAYIRQWFWPVPFGIHTDLHCLMLRCHNQITGKKVRYTCPRLVGQFQMLKEKNFPIKFLPVHSPETSLMYVSFALCHLVNTF